MSQHQHRTRAMLPSTAPFVFRRADEPIAKRVQSARLREACQSAFCFLEEQRRDLAHAERRRNAPSCHMRRVEALLDQLTRALQGTLTP